MLYLGHCYVTVKNSTYTLFKLLVFYDTHEQFLFVYFQGFVQK